MKLYIKAKPKSKKEYVKKIDDTHYTVAVKEPPVHGRANQAVLKLLAQYFRKPASHIHIVSGLTAKQKIIEVPITTEELSVLDLQKKLF